MNRPVPDKLRKLMFNRTAILGCCLLLQACVQNPVTGERNLQFYDSDWEREIGSGLYEPMRQSQGGDLVIDPELTEYIQQVGKRLASQSRRGSELEFEFNVLNDSTPNAWALPGGKIAINRGLLLELQSEAELAAVLGHEVVHADAAHSARQQSKGMLTQIGAIAGMILIDSTVDSTAGKQAAGLIPAIGAQLLSQSYSRDAERESDQYGMTYMSEAGYDPQGAVQLQETFVRLSEDRPDDWMSGLFASHPPSRERVENNKATARDLPEGGEMGRDRYRQNLARLRQMEPAYKLYDQAMKASGEEKYETARQHLDEAMGMVEDESIFHVLDGDLHQEAGNLTAAMQAYNRAITLYDGFFYHHLRRGYLNYENNEARAARTDLERSLDLLPTAAAHYLVGNLDRDAGNLDAARHHYGSAAKSNGDAGLRAERELIRMDIQSNPGKFVSTYGVADSQGNVYCLVGNGTRSDLAGIRVAARFLDDQGKVNERSSDYREVLEGGQRAGVPMGWRTTDPASIDRRSECVVRSARLNKTKES